MRFIFTSKMPQQRAISTPPMRTQSPAGWRNAVILTVVMAVLGVTACSTGDTSTENVRGEIEVIENVSYEDGGELDVYVPQQAEDWPVVVLFHGNPPPSREPLARLAEAVASQRILVMNVGWRSNAVAWDTVEGVGCAVEFARSSAGRYGGDPSRITVAGYSAGASASVAVALAGDELQGNCIESAASPLPDAFVGIAGFYDPAVTPDDARSEVKTSHPDLYRFLNPMNHLGRNMKLDVALVHGTEDGIAPVETSTHFHEALEDAGYEASLTVIDGADHNEVRDAAVTIDTIVRVANAKSAS